MRNKFVLAALALCLGSAAFAAPATYSAFIGANFFGYDYTALETGVGVAIPLQEGLAFEAKAAYAVRPSAGDAFMAIPLQAGVRFAFGSGPLGFTCALGMEPVFVLNPSSFRLGPYLGLEAALRVHQYLEVFAGVEQNLLFGGPSYVATGTRIQGGLRFSLSE
ncbi:MAG TPA: hypothetical protein P5165_04580 [Spirochaetia bacterium]|nr:hypothetical protein [Spirochaetia bacterium]